MKQRTLLIAILVWASGQMVLLHAKSSGVPNYNNSYVNSLIKKHRLITVDNVIKIKNKKLNTITSYVIKEYHSKARRFIVYFQKNPKIKPGPVLNEIYILSASESQAKSLAMDFVNSSLASKKKKTTWNKYLKKISFENRPVEYRDRAGVPVLRGLSHKRVYSAGGKVIYYLELSILE